MTLRGQILASKESFPLVRNNHVIHQSWWYDHTTWVTLDRTNASQFTIFIFTDFKPCLDASKIEAMEPILVCKFFFKLTSESSFQHKRFSNALLHLLLVLVIVSNHVRDALRDATLKWIPFAFLVSKKYSPNSVLFGDLFLCVNGLCLRMCWRRIAAAAATACRGGRGYPDRGGDFSRCTLEGSTFVLTLLESCEPCSWFTTANLEDSEHTLLRFSSFVRNEEL